jgi:Tfp pilus assembly protein PilN
MVQVNLLPKAYQVRCRRAGRIRRWLLFCGTLVMAETLSAHFLHLLAAQVREDRAHLAAVEKESQELATQQARLIARQRDLSSRLLLIDRLARKHYWSRVLTTVSGRLPETVVLTGLQTEPPKGQVVAPPANAARLAESALKPGGKPEPRRQGVATGFLLTGIATDHESVAELMKGLNQERQFGQCQLEATNRQPYMSGEGVTFTIRMRWE